MPQKQRKDRHFPHGKRCELADGDAHSCTCYRTVPLVLREWYCALPRLNLRRESKVFVDLWTGNETYLKTNFLLQKEFDFPLALQMHPCVMRVCRDSASRAKRLECLPLFVPILTRLELVAREGTLCRRVTNLISMDFSHPFHLHFIQARVLGIGCVFVWVNYWLFLRPPSFRPIPPWS